MKSFRYVSGPDEDLISRIPYGRLLCHNKVHIDDPYQRHGERGFRVFTIDDESDGGEVEGCPCGWRPDLRDHFVERR
jgi:hypothetical protein